MNRQHLHKSVSERICRDCSNAITTRFSELCNSCLIQQNGVSVSHEITVSHEISSDCLTVDCTNEKAHNSTRFCYDCISKFINKELELQIPSEQEWKCVFCRKWNAKRSRSYCDTCSSVCHECGITKSPDNTHLCQECSMICPKCKSFTPGIVYCKRGRFGLHQCLVCDSKCPNCKNIIEGESFFDENGYKTGQCFVCDSKCPNCKNIVEGESFFDENGNKIGHCVECENESKGNLRCSNCGTSTRNIGVNSRLFQHTLNFSHRRKILCNACSPHAVNCGVCDDQVEIKLTNDGGYTNLNISIYVNSGNDNWYRCGKTECRDTDLRCSKCQQIIDKDYLISQNELSIKKIQCTSLCKLAQDLSDTKLLFSKYYSRLKSAWSEKSYARCIAEGISQNPSVVGIQPTYSTKVVINRAESCNYHGDEDYYAYRRSYSKIWERSLIEFEEILFATYSKVTVEIDSWKVQRPFNDTPTFDYPLTFSYSCFD